MTHNVRTYLQEQEERLREITDDNVSMHVFEDSESDLVLIQIPHCDDIETSCEKFGRWKESVENELPEVVVTDVYDLPKTFNRVIL